MKKMIGFGAVALCAAVACADVTSANTVGYMNTNLRANYTATGASFCSIGAEGFKLSELKMTGLPKTVNGTIVIQLLDDLGSTKEIYKYYKGGRGSYATEGWYNATTLIDGSDADHEILLPKGQGLWFKGVADLSFTSSGEVIAGDFTTELRANYTLLSNPFPAAIKLSKIKLEGLPKTVNGTIVIQLLDDLGSTKEIYKYYKGGRGSYATEGWYNATTLIDGSDADHEIEIPAGVAMWFKGIDGLSATLTCPYTLNGTAAE